MTGAHLYVSMGNVVGDGNGYTVRITYSLIHRQIYSFIVVGLGYHDDLQTRAVFMEVLTRILQQVCDYSFMLLIL